jgi:hypothetical protein
MELPDAFWRGFELDLQEVKIQYLRWAIDHATEPGPRYQARFLWDHQSEFCIVNSRYGRAFSQSPFGSGTRGVPPSEMKGDPTAASPEALAVKQRLFQRTRSVRDAIRRTLSEGEITWARHMVLDFWWLKVGPHELLFDRVQNIGGRRGKWRLPELEHTPGGVRDRIINVIRYGEELQDAYLERMIGPINTFRTRFLSTMRWDRYATCVFDCGPVLWSRSGFVHFSTVKDRMNELDWPYRSTAREILKPFYHVALDYNRYPIRDRKHPDEGYSLRSMRQRGEVILKVLDKVSEELALAR